MGVSCGINERASGFATDIFHRVDIYRTQNFESAVGDVEVACVDGALEREVLSFVPDGSAP